LSFNLGAHIRVQSLLIYVKVMIQDLLQLARSRLSQILGKLGFEY